MRGGSLNVLIRSINSFAKLDEQSDVLLLADFAKVASVPPLGSSTATHDFGVTAK
jgi:hypothetical protein